MSELTIKYWSKVIIILDKTSCWEWQKSLDTCGYGSGICYNGWKLKAHRQSYYLIHGSIPEGKQINHHCDNPKCVRPSHIYAGTSKDNTADIIRRDRRQPNWGEYNPRAKLTERQVLEVRESTISNHAIARKYGISSKLVRLIKKKERWGYL